MPITGFANENAVIYRSWMKLKLNTMRLLAQAFLYARRMNSRLRKLEIHLRGLPRVLRNMISSCLGDILAYRNASISNPRRRGVKADWTL